MEMPCPEERHSKPLPKAESKPLAKRLWASALTLENTGAYSLGIPPASK